jgi:hypothetical protein
MNQPMFKRVFPQTMIWAGLVILCGVNALAQETAAAPPPAAEVRADGQIEMDVVHALDSSQALKNELITAATMQGEVTLSGTVASDSNLKLAETIASQVAGVTKVNDNLKVVSAQAAEDTGDNGDQDMGQSQPGAQNQGAPNPGAGQPVTRDRIRTEVQSQMQAQRQTRLQTPSGPVTVPPGTLLRLRTNEPVGSKRAKDGQPVEFTVIQTVAVGGMRAIPRGATVHGVVTEVQQSGALAGEPVLALTLTSLELGGQSYPLSTDQFKVRGPGKGARSANNMIGGTMMGTIIGCMTGRGVGCAIGAGAGLAAGTAASAATPGPGVWIPAEALVDFHLNAPLTVNPVSVQEAARLAQGLYQGGPNLYQRGYYPNGQSYPYGYPPIYYRPYYAVGGNYYWR